MEVGSWPADLLISKAIQRNKMILEKGDMWSIYDQTDLFLITTNSTLNAKGELVMGAGIAKERFPDLPALAGNYIKRHLCFYGVAVFGAPRIGLFQTKTYWASPSDLQLILRSTAMLIERIERAKQNYYLFTRDEFRVDLNFPGIGKGGLDRQDVLPIIKILPNNVHIWEY